MTPDQELAWRKRLVAAARAMLSMQVGLSVGALRFVAILRQLGDPYKARHGVFGDYLASIPTEIPLGTARLYWAPRALMERDAMLADIEAGFRGKLLQELHPDHQQLQSQQFTEAQAAAPRHLASFCPAKLIE